jgi:succinate dehydrogenase/fumarate reductase flavoprotein subunit
MVFGSRVVEAVERGKDGPDPSGAMRCVLPSGEAQGNTGAAGIPGRRLARSFPGSPDRDAGPARVSVSAARASLQREMTAGAGVLRSAASLHQATESAAEALRTAELAGRGPVTDPAVCELRNLATVGSALCTAASARTESRGAHARRDFPDVSTDQRVRYVIVDGRQ